MSVWLLLKDEEYFIMRTLVFGVLAIFVLPSVAAAGGVIGNITGVIAHSGDGGNGSGLFMFSVEGQRSGAPSCNTANEGKDWAMSLESEAGRAMYALVLSAHAQGKRIYVTGTGHCDSWGDREQPEWISVGQ